MTLDDTLTHEPHVAAPTEATAQPTVTTRKTRETKSTIDGTVLTVTGAGETHAYDLAEIPAATRDYLALIGLRTVLAGSDDPAERYAELKSGNYTGRKPAATKPLDDKRLAIAHAALDIEVERNGLKARPGKPKSILATVPDYIRLFDQAKAHAATLTSAEVKDRHKRRDVAMHYVRLTTEDAPAEGLLPVPVVALAAE